MQVPARKQVKDLFEGLLGREVAIGDAATTVTPHDKPGTAVAVYVDDDGRLACLAMMDLALAAYSGSALALLPPGGAQDAISDGTLPESLMENAYEILNVLAAPIGDASGLHQKLMHVFPPSEQPPAELAAMAVTLGSRDDVTIDVAGYGMGRLAIVGAPGR